MEMYKSKYYEKVQKVKLLGLKIEDGERIEEDIETYVKILNATVYKKKPLDAKTLDINIIDSTLKAIKEKHELYIGYIMPVKSTVDNKTSYSFSLRLRNDHIDTIYARTMLEGMLKSLIVLYYHIKLKEDNKNEWWI